MESSYFRQVKDLNFTLIEWLKFIYSTIMRLQAIRGVSFHVFFHQLKLFSQSPFTLLTLNYYYQLLRAHVDRHRHQVEGQSQIFVILYL